MKYTYTVGPEPGSMKIDKEKIFSQIISECDNLNGCDSLVVFGFGEKGDLMLDILKDGDYDAGRDPELYNIVTIVTSQKKEDDMMKRVDDTEDTYVTDGSLYKELERIWNYREFGLL